MSQRGDGSRSRSSATRSSAAIDQSQAIEMIRSLRVTELQTFLSELGQSKVGRKADLVERALGTVRSLTPAHFHKLSQLFSSRQGTHHGALTSPSTTSSYAAPPSRAPVTPAITDSAAACHAPASSQSSGSHSMPTINNLTNYFSSPSSIMSGKLPSSRYADPGAGSSSWTAAVPAPAPVIPPLEEFSSIRFSSLPFYDEVNCLIQPTNLNPTNHSNTVRGLDGTRSIFQEMSRTFTLTTDQANSLSMNRKILPTTSCDGYDGAKVEFKKQLLLRFALSCPSSGSTSAIIDDCLPPSLCLRVNGKLCSLPLPAVTKGCPKDGQGHRSSRPVDITSLTKFSPVVSNLISITWHQPSVPYNSSLMDYSKRFVFTLVMVSKLSPDELVQKVRGKGTKSAEYTISIIRDKLRDEDAEIATTSLRASLLCPLAKMRMRVPSRALTCTHIQCFDISFFLQMNEKKPSWICPVCDSKIKFTDLVIDGLFTEILNTDTSLNKTEVQFDEVNGQIEWSPIVKAENRKPANLLTSDGIDDVVTGVTKRKTTAASDPATTRKKKQCPEVVTIDDSDDDDEGAEDTIREQRSSGNSSAAAAAAAATCSWNNSFQQPIELSLSDDDDDDESVGDDSDSDDGHDNSGLCSVMDFRLPSSRSRTRGSSAHSSSSHDPFVALQSPDHFLYSSAAVRRPLHPNPADDEDDDDIAIIE